MNSPADGPAVRKLARRLIRQHFGQAPRKLVFQDEGLSNSVFFFRHSGSQYVLRLSPEPQRLRDFLKEQWAQAAAKEIGVPTPIILQVDNDESGAAYMISQFYPGQTALRFGDRQSIVRELGHWASRIHTIRTEGFGTTFDWSQNQLSRCKTWSDWLKCELKMQERLELLAKHELLSAAQVRRVAAALRGASKSKDPPVLNHGDLRLKNVLVDGNGKIVCLMDWEHCTSNLPAWEISIALHDLSIDEKHAFLEGYGFSRRDLQAQATLLKAINVINYAPVVERLLELGDRAELERCRIRLAGLLDLYSPN